MNGAFVWTVLLGLFVLFMIYTAQHFPDLLQFTPNLAGYGTLVMISNLIIGNFYPSILSWTETTLQDLWGDTKPDNDLVELEDETLEKAVSWSANLSRIKCAIGSTMCWKAISPSEIP